MIFYLEVFLKKIFEYIDKIHHLLAIYFVINLSVKITTKNLAVIHNLNNYQSDLEDIISFFESF